MAYCGPRGIALHDFLAWPDESQQAALQWQAWESRRCPRCHTHPEDWDPQQGGSRTFQHWHAKVCLGCQAKERAEASLAQDKDKTRGLGIAAAEGSAGVCEVCNPSE